MKATKNTSIQHKFKTGDYICERCNCLNSAIALWREVTYGTANVTSTDVELENYETVDSDHFEIDNFQCTNCEAEHTSFEDGFINIEDYEGEVKDRNDFGELVTIHFGRDT